MQQVNILHQLLYEKLNLDIVEDGIQKQLVNNKNVTIGLDILKKDITKTIMLPWLQKIFNPETKPNDNTQ